MSSDACLAPPLSDRTDASAQGAAVNAKTITRLTTFAIYCLPILTFTTPGRPSPSSLAFLDGLAMFKLVVLLIVFFGGVPIILLLHQAQPRKTLRTLGPLIPYFLFVGWAVLSVLWSPLPAVTMGQSGGLASLLIMAALLGISCQDESSVQHALRTLSRMLLGFSLFVLIIHLVAPHFSGLDRRMLVAGSDGVVHPTAAGANSSLGLLVAVLCHFVGRYPWAFRMLLASVIIHGAVLVFASSRTALGMALITIPIIFFLNTNNNKRALVLIATSAVAIAFLLFDPGFGSVLDTNSTSVQYITRGQDANQIKGISGRAEMWEKVWIECTKSPAIGHGYFVTSQGGAMEVWYMKANHTAHNIHLQVLAGTGAVGFLLFLVAILRPFLHFQSLRSRDKLARQVCQMLVFVFIWYLGWSFLCASFMGPVRSESVVFFAFMGLGVGQLARFSKSNRATEARPTSDASLAADAH